VDKSCQLRFETTAPDLEAYKLLPVAFSICSSKAELAEDDHQPIILAGGKDAWRF
jgi:hypothetical protein